MTTKSQGKPDAIVMLRRGKLTRRQSLIGLGGAAASLFAPSYVKAAPITVRLGDVTPTDNPEYAAHVFFAKRISEETKGQYEVKIFPNSVLGGHTQMNEQLRNGTLEMAKSGQGFPATYDKALGIFSLPYLYATRAKLFAALDGKLGDGYRKAAAQYGFVTLGFYDSGIRNVYNTRGSFKTPEEFAALKLKIRVQPDKIMVATFNLLGAQSAPIEFAEVYNALQQGVVDAAENSVPYYISMKHIEVAKYFTKTQHLFGVDPLFASAKWFNAQPENIQKIFNDVARETVEYERKNWLEAENKDYARATSAGTLINEADILAFQHKVKPIWAQYKGDLGGLYDIVESTQ
jgi:tripartite ATP-independent transporter DctP family solute receptor